MTKGRVSQESIEIALDYARRHLEAKPGFLKPDEPQREQERSSIPPAIGGLATSETYGRLQVPKEQQRLF